MDGFIYLTLAKSGSIVTVRAKHISFYYRKDIETPTEIYINGAIDFIRVRETPEEIEEILSKLHPDWV